MMLFSYTTRWANSKTWRLTKCRLASWRRRSMHNVHITKSEANIALRSLKSSRSDSKVVLALAVLSVFGALSTFAVLEKPARLAGKVYFSLKVYRVRLFHLPSVCRYSSKDRLSFALDLPKQSQRSADWQVACV